MRAALVVAAAILLVGIVSTASGARPAPAPAPDPTIAQVLASGSDAQFWGIQNLSEVTLDSIRSEQPWYSSTSVSLDQDVELQATDGGTGSHGGNVTLKSGYGDGGNTAGSAVEVQGGKADGPGYVVIVSGDSAGQPGDCLRNVGSGRAAWGPCTP